MPPLEIGSWCGQRAKRQPVAAQLALPALLDGYIAGEQISFVRLSLESLVRR
jgi:hypothetical protein